MSADPLQQWPVPKPGERPILTPGPWGIAAETNGTEMVAYSANPWRVRAVLVRGDFSQNPNWRADTKAMSATPQLVEAMLSALPTLRSLEQFGEDRVWRPARLHREAFEAALHDAGVLP